MPHIYLGPLAPIGICQTCKKSGYDFEEHYFNACTDPCDNADGPCACGAWHKPEDFPVETK